LLAAEVRGRYSIGIALGLGWILIMGPPPLPDRVDVVVGLLGQGAALGLGSWVLLRSQPTTLEKPFEALKPMRV
jgi:hypothetical protein